MPRPPDELADLLFVATLRRAPAAAERAAMTARLRAGADLGDLLAEFAASAEFRTRDLQPAYDWRQDPGLARFLTPDVVALSARLQHEHPLDAPAFDRAWHARFEVQLGHSPAEERNRQYGNEHRRRFVEAVQAIALLRQTHGVARMLEFGLSVFSAMYHRLFPDLVFVTADRPVTGDERVFFESISRQAGAAAHVMVDLTDPAFLTADQRAAFGTFDLILLTEVLEHLLVHPVVVLKQLRELLRPGGHLYLTAPNFFSVHHLAEVAQRINPQAVFPRAGNGDTHYHHREPCMREVLGFLVEAGFEIAAFYFSGCWEDAATTARLVDRPDQHSNLVVLARSPRT